MKSKKLLFTQLTGCSGCLMTVLGMEILKDLTEAAKIDFYPFLCDNREDEYDIIFVEGCCANDERQLMELRECTKILVALGSCAVMGGITSLNKQERSYPLNKIVNIDYEIPGCPPPPALLGRGIMNILAGKSFELQDQTLCFDCKFFGQLTEKSYLDKIAPEKPPKSCFLKEGVLCLGPITRGGIDGCEAACINANVPCEGCTGSSRNFAAAVINMLSVFSVKKELQEYEGLYFRFSRPDRK
jgi:F420-non-reducing hydrogenase small subunit